MQPTGNTVHLALRVATVMQQLGIEGLPRNYELVFEAMTGNSPDLARELKSLGATKSQKVLDGIGRRYLPHHYEGGLLEARSGQVQQELQSILSLLDEEKTALTRYGTVISQAARVFDSNELPDSSALKQSLKFVSSATHDREAQSAMLASKVVEKSQKLEQVQREAEAANAARFVDPITGLGNRRVFNKEMAKIYERSGLPDLCGIAFAELDTFEVIAGVPNLVEPVLKKAGELIQSLFGKDDLACRFDRGRFGFVFRTADETEIMRLVDRLRDRLKGVSVAHPVTGKQAAVLTLSVGLCMSKQARTADALMAFSEQALGMAKASGGDNVSIHGATNVSQVPKDWLIYR
ncbi:diguanylate cyclase [Rhizobium sp. Root1220]|nr:diguanylate cyclase [Rhizobium sp. Root1220]